MQRGLKKKLQYTKKKLQPGPTTHHLRAVCSLRHARCPRICTSTLHYCPIHWIQCCEYVPRGRGKEKTARFGSSFSNSLKLRRNRGHTVQRYAHERFMPVHDSHFRCSREFHPQTRNKVAEGAVLEILRLGIVLVETAALLRMISLQCAFAMQTATARHWRI